jgi:glycosyltransferase 2 family protein
MALPDTIRRTLILILKLSVTVLVVAVLVAKLGIREIIRTVDKADPYWLLAAVAMFILSAWLGVVQWRILLANRGIPLPQGRAFKLYFIGLFFNNFVFGGFVGDAVKVASIHAQEKKALAGLAATFLDRFAGLWAMCGFAVLGSLVLLRRGALTNGKIDTAVIALFGAFALFAAILVFLVSKPFQNTVFRIIDRFPFTKRMKIKEIVSEMLIEAHDMHLLVSVSLLSAVIQSLRIGVHIITAGSLGLLTTHNFQYFLIFVPIIAMLMTLPFPFGVREAAGGALFALAGFPTGAAFIMNFLASIVGIASSLLGGVFFITGRIHLFGRRNETVDSSTIVQ